MNATTLERELLSSYLDDGGFPTEAENVRTGIDLESYEDELRLIVWVYRHYGRAHLNARKQVPQFVNAEALATWLETLHECDGGGTVSNRKWNVAQAAAKAARSAGPNKESE